MLAALVYSVVCRRISLRPLLFMGVLMTAAGSLFYLGYHPTKLMAEVIEFGNGFLAVFGALTLYDLATRGTPRGGEGMGYALMMSARNVALFGADVVGSKLLDRFHLPWDGLVWLNAGTTLVCLFLIPFLPSVLMRHKDGDDIGDPNATGEQISAIEPMPQKP